MSFALRVRRASMNHLNPTGWFSAGLPPMVGNVVLEGDAFRAEASSADGRVRIPLDVDNRGGRVLRFVAQGVNDHAARDRAIGTDGARLGGAGDLQRAHLGARLGDVEAE